MCGIAGVFSLDGAPVDAERLRRMTDSLRHRGPQYGPDCLERLDGMFAFALWDEASRALFCARDRFGEKPFFYCLAPGRSFAFASEVKALRFSLESYGLEKLLRSADRNSMAFSREVWLPFLSHHLVEFALALPSSYKLSEGWNKHVLRLAMESTLPREVAWRVDKIGFRPPQEAWLAHPSMAPLLSEARAHLVREELLSAPQPGRDWRYLVLSRLILDAA